MNELDKGRFFDYVDRHQSQYIEQLSEAVAYVGPTRLLVAFDGRSSLSLAPVGINILC
jgi:hypothetical protein